jgi:hypothetical protein
MTVIGQLGFIQNEMDQLRKSRGSAGKDGQQLQAGYHWEGGGGRGMLGGGGAKQSTRREWTGLWEEHAGLLRDSLAGHWKVPHPWTLFLPLHNEQAIRNFSQCVVE